MLRLGSRLRHPLTREPAHVVQFRGVGHAVCRTLGGVEFTILKTKRGAYRRPDGVCRGCVQGGK